MQMMDQSRIVSSGLFGKLSYEIISDIFLYLNQQDCLNCMVTCRAWYDLVPQFTQANWKRLQLNKKGVSQRQERNLGTHVKHVLFYDVQVDLAVKMMQKLLDCKCTEIQSLEFTPCINETALEQRNIFLNLLCQLASQRLTHLKLTYQHWNYSITDLLYVCPHLTHFSYYANYYSNRVNQDYTLMKPIFSNRTSNNNLICLHVDTKSHIIKDQVKSIICNSPNLRCFIGASSDTCRNEQKMSISPEFVLENCPNLEYYAGDGSYQPGDRILRESVRKSQWPSLPASATTSKNINCRSNDQEQKHQQNLFHHLSVRNNKNANQLINLLDKYKDTLKHFRLSEIPAPRGNRFDWTRTFRTVTLHQLHTFDCDVRIYSKESIISLLNTCSSTIEDVRLRHFGFQTLDVPTLVRLRSLPQLRTLSIRYFKFADESSVLNLLRRVPLIENLTFEKSNRFILSEQAAPLLKNLRRLTIEDSYVWHQNNTVQVLPPPISPGLVVSLSQGGSKLESVRLKNTLDTGIPFVVLDALTALPSLKSLHAYGTVSYSEREHYEEKKEQHMLNFFNGFLIGRDNNMSTTITSSSSSSSTIQDLTFHDVYKLTYSMLRAIGGLTSLENVCISLVGIPNLDNEELLLKSECGYLNLDLHGVLELLRKGRKLRRITFERVVTFGKYLPSYYIEKQLFQEQKNNYDLRKYFVAPARRIQGIGKSGLLFKSTIEIIRRSTYINKC